DNSASRSAAISGSGKIFSTAANSASGKNAAREFQLETLSKKSSCLRTVGQITQMAESRCHVLAMVATRKDCALSMTWLKRTGKSAVAIWRSLRSIGSAAAASLRKSPFSTRSCRRKGRQLQRSVAQVRSRLALDSCATQLIRDRYWRADANRFKKIFGHEFRHPNASVRRRIAG